MEPPVKRRRVDESPSDSENDDELCFEPHEVLAKRDPGYELSLQRAYAEHRFQATMAHIFEKYSRNFEGIGDEIDMMTGEIVVDNGHLSRMRDEGDVGDGTHEEPQDEAEDEDEGIRLEDLLGDEELDGDEYNKDDGKEGGLAAGREDEDSHEWHPQSHDRAESALLHPQDRRLPGPVTDSRGCPYPPDPMSLALSYGPSFDHRPPLFGTGLWDLPPDFDDPLRDMQDRCLPPGLGRSLGSRSARYSFPAQAGHTSIWGGKSGYNDDEPAETPSKTTSKGPTTKKTMSKWRQSILAPAALNSNNDDKSKALAESTADLEKKCVSDPSQDVEDDELVSGEETRKGDLSAGESSSKPTEPIGTETDKDPAGELSTETPNTTTTAEPSSSLENRPQPDVTETLTHAEIIDQVISSTEAVPDGAHSSRIMVELRPLDTKMREEYMQVDDDEYDVVDAAASEHGPSDIAADTTSTRVIPNSQSTSTSLEGIQPPPDVEMALQETQAAADTAETSAAPVEKPIRERGEPAEEIVLHRNPIFDLSDDESPLPLSAISKRSQPPEPHQAQANLDENPSEPSQGGLNESPAQEAAVASAPSPPASKDPEPLVPESVVERIEEPPPRRKRGRPRFRKEINPTDKVASSPAAERKASQDSASQDATSMGSGRVEETKSGPSPQSLSRGGKDTQTQEGDPADRDEPLASHNPDQSCDLAAQEAPPRIVEQQVVDDEPAEETMVLNAPADAAQGSHDPPSEATLADQAAPENSAATTTTHSPVKSPIQAPPNPPLPEPISRTPSKVPTPKTPRHSVLRSTRAPRSRRSVLSLLSDDDEDGHDDELSQMLPRSSSSSAVIRKIWKSSARTTEVYRTPVKKKRSDPVSPGSIVRTPGGTVRACGVDGYRCARDFCFTCL